MKWLKRTAGLSNTMCQGNDIECHRLAGELHRRLRFGRTQRIFRDGLHEFLTGVIDDTAVLGDEIGRFYMADVPGRPGLVATPAFGLLSRR